MLLNYHIVSTLIAIYAHKRSVVLLEYSNSEVFGVTYQQNNQKPTQSREHSRYIPAGIQISRQTF